MSKRPSISFSEFEVPQKGVAVVLVAKGGGFADEAAKAVGGAEKIARIADISGFTGALGKTAEAIETTRRVWKRSSLSASASRANLAMTIG